MIPWRLARTLAGSAAIAAVLLGCGGEVDKRGQDWSKRARQWTLKVNEDYLVFRAVNLETWNRDRKYGPLRSDPRAGRDLARVLQAFAGCQAELDRVGHAPTDALAEIESDLRTSCEELERGARLSLEDLRLEDPGGAEDEPADAGYGNVDAGSELAYNARQRLDELGG